MFASNPRHPSLRFKQVCRNPLTYAARVGLAYRAVGVIVGDGIIWYWIGSHAEYDQLLKQL